MKTIAINGSHGFLGKQICKYFEHDYRIIQIIREDYLIDPNLLAKKLVGADIIINLAGSRISPFLTTRKKKIIYDSRILTTQNLVRAIQLMDVKPSYFISFSAVGIYSFEGFHDEQSQNFGDNFLASVCTDWERAAAMNFQGINVLNLRCGIVLSKDEGMLAAMLPPFRLGIGAVLGSGKQPVPFIHIHDFLSAFRFAIDHRLTGIVNFVAPIGCTNFELSDALNLAMKRPFLFHIPSFVIRTLLGTNSYLVLEGQHVIPKRLLDEGFDFKYPEIGIALNNIINSHSN
jgi:uncharacterized protein